MVVVADASVAIRGDLDPYRRDLKGAERETSTFGKRIRDILSPRNVIAGAGLLGIGLGIRQLVGYAGDAAAAFSDLQQTTRTVDAVFGDSADVIHEWGEVAAEAAGFSKKEVNDAAAVMGQTLLNMGFAADEAAAKVVQLQQRAADLALAFGKDPQDAILAITAAMRGERDTIEKFGVSIREADVKSRVLALGLDTSTAAAKKNSDAIAILDIILGQSATSADRFADSQDDVAVKMAQAQAKIENGMADFGQVVASIQLGAIKVAESGGDLIDATGRDFDAFALNFGAQHVEILRMAEEAGISYEEMKQRILDAADLSGVPVSHVVATFDIEGMDATSDAAEAAFEDAARAAGNGVAAMAAQMRLGGPVVAREAGKIAGMLPSEIQRRVDDVRRAGMDSVVAFAAGILEKQNDPLLAMEALTKANEEALTRGEEIARLKGQLTSEELAKGLDDSRPEVRLAAQAARAVIIDRLSTLNAWDWGNNIGNSLADGMAAATDRVKRVAADMASATGGQIRIESEPPDHSSPLYGITKWGGNIVKTIADGIYGELGTGSAAAGALAGALVPSVAGSAFGVAGAMPMSDGGRTYVLQVNGVQYEVGTAQEAIETLQGLGIFGEGRV